MPAVEASQKQSNAQWSIIDSSHTPCNFNQSRKDHRDAQLKPSVLGVSCALATAKDPYVLHPIESLAIPL